MENQHLLDRRQFLKLSASGACAVCLAGCARLPFTGSSTPLPYWQEKKNDLMDSFDMVFVPTAKPLAELCGQAEADLILPESRSAYEALLPEVPYIGGDDNNLTQVLYMSAGALAFYRVMLAHGRSLEDTGLIIYRAMEALSQSLDPLSSADRRNVNGKPAQDEFKRMGRQLEKSTYPGDWKLTFIEGDGQNFDFGVDYTECGVVKFYQAQKAPELAPYMCLGDFPMSTMDGSGLARTTTLAHGAERCDFRYKAGRPVQMEWTPDFLK